MFENPGSVTLKDKEGLNTKSELTVDMLSRLQNDVIPAGAEVVIISCEIGEFKADTSDLSYQSIKTATSEPGLMYDFGGGKLAEDTEFRTIAVD
ncbi:MAG: hypothetical protein AAGF07_04220 [Patescibacteria group bacterium]